MYITTPSHLPLYGLGTITIHDLLPPSIAPRRYQYHRPTLRQYEYKINPKPIKKKEEKSYIIVVLSWDIWDKRWDAETFSWIIGAKKLVNGLQHLSMNRDRCMVSGDRRWRPTKPNDWGRNKIEEEEGIMEDVRVLAKWERKEREERKKKKKKKKIFASVGPSSRASAQRFRRAQFWRSRQHVMGPRRVL